MHTPTTGVDFAEGGGSEGGVKFDAKSRAEAIIRGLLTFERTTEEIGGTAALKIGLDTT